MTPETVLDIFRVALSLVVLIVAVVVTPALLVGLAVSIFQAATQINEQTLSFLPRLLTTLITIMLVGPWLLTTLVEYFERLILDIPLLIG